MTKRMFVTVVVTWDISFGVAVQKGQNTPWTDISIASSAIRQGAAKRWSCHPSLEEVIYGGHALPRNAIEVTQ